MKAKWFVTGLLAVSLLSLPVWAQEENPKPASRYSHTGLKAAVAFGGFQNDFSRELTDGEAGALSLGYGFSDKVSLWLTALGVEHPENAVNRSVTDFGGLELNFQYKFLPNSPLQPYGKLGAGLYATGEKGSNRVLQGGGLALALGIDWFFSRHVGVGLEAQFKSIQFNKERVTQNGQDVISDLNPKVDGESAGLMLTLTIQ